MIFLIVGTQEPFDRLVKIVDNWAKDNPDVEVYGQIGNSVYKPANFKYDAFLPSNVFNEQFNRSDFIISHAGMGTIISALVKGKPIIAFPRLVKYNEHRNDHQIDTTKVFQELNFIHTAFTEKELIEKLNNYRNIDVLKRIGKDASDDLINSLNKDFLEL